MEYAQDADYGAGPIRSLYAFDAEQCLYLCASETEPDPCVFYTYYETAETCYLYFVYDPDGLEVRALIMQGQN